MAKHPAALFWSWRPFLSDTHGVWENSWIRCPQARLSAHALHVFQADFKAVKNDVIRERSDAARFRFTQNGEPWLHIPISYAMKLSLADLAGTQPLMPEFMCAEVSRLMRHFLNDNTSPETTSFHIVTADSKHSLGERAAREAARRFLFTSLLISWANRRFGLLESGQRALVGSLQESSGLFLKQKFFSFPELLGESSAWRHSFEGGDYAVFRLTPEKYHYTHSPVSGRVLDIYSVEGRYYSCNPSAAVRLLTPFSKNCRVVTILDTDCAGGTAIGRVAMIEVVALMVGRIEQRYSECGYENPQSVEKSMFLRTGSPKALFRPGSSTVVLLFQPHRVHFANDLVENQQRGGVQSRFSVLLGTPLIETDVAVRSLLAMPAGEQAS